MIAQLTPKYGLNLSPILLIFHKNPVTPDRFSRSPGFGICANSVEMNKDVSIQHIICAEISMSLKYFVDRQHMPLFDRIRAELVCKGLTCPPSKIVGLMSLR